LPMATPSIVTDLGSRQVSLKCTGTSPKVAITPNLIAFGIVAVAGTSSPVAVAIANTGSDVLNITRLDITGNDFADFTSMDMPMTLPAKVAPGAKLQFTVVFSPANAAGESAQI